jgi:hypothetical protein
MNAGGYSVSNGTTSGQVEDTNNAGINKLAVLWGSPFGGFRFDWVSYGDGFYTNKSDGAVTSSLSSPFTTTLTWGDTIAGLPLRASIGVL